MCQHCHGGVGVSRDAWAKGIDPQPPDLTKEAAEWKPRELFWIVKHGIKMTAMPAFGGSHDDATLWNIAAFVNALLKMSAAQYAAYRAKHGEEHEGEHAD
jgi:mono/diheme cytochrome c family protein